MRKILNHAKKTIIITIFFIFIIVNFVFAEENRDYDPVVIVSMGDSYSAGEGVEPFYGQNDNDGKKIEFKDKIKNPDWLAHRSINSWPGQLSVNNCVMNQNKVKTNVNGCGKEIEQGQPAYWFFVATSGAETKHILTEPQEKNIAELL